MDLFVRDIHTYIYIYIDTYEVLDIGIDVYW